MKTFFATCLVLVSWLVGLSSAHAQAIANLGFETWATRNGADAPTNWQNSDDYLHALLVAGLGYTPYVNTNTVTKITSAHSGTYAANLTTQNVSIPLLGQQPFPGIVLLGSVLTANGIGGVAYTNRPAQFQFYYQYTGPASDSAAAIVVVTKTVSGQPQILGRATQYFQPTTGSSYVLSSLPISYTSSLAPDSVRIIFISGNARSITVGSSLKIDDVALVGTALANRADATLQAQLTVSPNPSPGGRFQLSAPDAPALASAPLTVLDLTGRVVMQKPALAIPNSTRELDLSSLAIGSYLLRLDTKDGAIVRQLSIK